MAAVSVDTYATTNPAFCSLVLRAFLAGHGGADRAGAPLPLVILPLPVVLTEQIASTLRGTNASTGLLPWVARNPEVTIGLAERLEKTAPFSRQALLFGLRYRVISMTPEGRLVPADEGLARQPSFPASTDAGRVLRLAKRFGAWTGQVREPDTIFINLGVSR